MCEQFDFTTKGLFIFFTTHTQTNNIAPTHSIQLPSHVSQSLPWPIREPCHSPLFCAPFGHFRQAELTAIQTREFLDLCVCALTKVSQSSPPFIKILTHTRTHAHTQTHTHTERPIDYSFSTWFRLQFKLAIKLLESL